MVTAVGTSNGVATGSSASAGTLGKVFDPRDTNKDGTVSFMEQVNYDLSHPEMKNLAATTGSYTFVGMLAAYASPTSVDTYA
jgi:hypothetical protein